MKLKTNFLDKEKFEKLADHLKDIDFTLFADDVPASQQDFSKVNILILQEPNEYFGLHSWAVQNHKQFDAILTWDDYVLNNCFNAMFLPFGHTWFKEEQYSKEHNKNYNLAHLRGNLLKTYGHSIRHEIFARKNEIKGIPLNFYDSYGDRNNIEEARIGKEKVFGSSMFGIAIENTSHNGYFTEKILDCFLMKTIPLYWGCSSIGKIFDSKGIITFENADDLITKANTLLNRHLYSKLLPVIEENYTRALQFTNFEQNIINILNEIFKLNGLLQ